ncbi:MAG TPA: hypothetical protein VJI15_06635 [Candidatus Nanoarchaeia archaeon]|nr:hypothetical protein [Candidatus Nanoarchaeia archaeon]
MKGVSDVKAQCRICGRSTAASEFRMSVNHRMMVCPLCFSGKTAAEQEKKKVQEVKRPAGWDEVDEYLAKNARRKDQEVSSFTPIAGSSLLKYKCPECDYSTKYDPDKMVPGRCPYCGALIKAKRSF